VTITFFSVDLAWLGNDVLYLPRPVILVFFPRDWGKAWKSSVRILVIPAEIWTRNLRNNRSRLHNNYRPVNAVQGKVAVYCENRTKQPVWAERRFYLILKQVVSIDTAFFLKCEATVAYYWMSWDFRTRNKRTWRTETIRSRLVVRYRLITFSNII
jgi:hypothetical protein